MITTTIRQKIYISRHDNSTSGISTQLYEEFIINLSFNRHDSFRDHQFRACVDSSGLFSSAPLQKVQSSWAVKYLDTRTSSNRTLKPHHSSRDLIPNTGNYYGLNFILYSLSSPFLSVHWLLDKLDMIGSKMQLVNGITLLTTFFCSRML